MDGMIYIFHHAKNKNNYKDSIRKLKKLEGYLKRNSLRQAVDTYPDFVELVCCYP
jgi:hypothetical protein